MKHRNLFLTGALCFSGLLAGAQKTPPQREPDYGKPLLFAALPASMPVHPEALNYLLQVPVGDSVTFSFSTTLVIKGIVVSHADGSDKALQSVVVRTSNMGGATLSLARRNEAGIIEYSGRIISEKHGDALELVQEAGQYHLKKRGLYDLLSE